MVTLVSSGVLTLMCTSQGLLLLVADQVERKAFNVFSHATVFSWVGEVGEERGP